ncbi:response regulator [Pedobacter jamesrossensis]|uniref:Response regulator n=1 Tax=Pedobacter jamesrossensis TaxID=1908238 RepID=A0ABV8NL11_9SPHI
MINTTPQTNYRILIIDDDDIALFLHSTILEDIFQNIVIETFNKAALALKYLKANAMEKNEYLIFLDINMPEVNGWEFLEAIKSYENIETAKVIIVSSSVEITEKEKAQNISFVKNFLIKPLMPEQVEQLRYLEAINPFFRQ